MSSTFRYAEQRSPRGGVMSSTSRHAPGPAQSLRGGLVSSTIPA